MDRVINEKVLKKNGNIKTTCLQNQEEKFLEENEERKPGKPKFHRAYQKQVRQEKKAG